MGTSELIVISILSANTLAAAVYLIVSLIRRRNAVSKTVQIFLTLLICPVAGFAFFIFSWLFQMIFFRRGVDVSDVIFSKDRTTPVEKADDEREMNIVPVEEGVAVMDDQHMRSFMLNILRGDLGTSLSSIAAALESNDSETAHYAASFLSDTLNEFRAKMQEVYRKLRDELKELSELHEADQTEYSKRLAEVQDGLFEEGNQYLYTVDVVLDQHVFTISEQREWTDHLTEIADGMYLITPECLSADTYTFVGRHLLDVGRFEECEVWANRFGEEIPNVLSYFTLRLELYYRWHKREEFFAAMDDLKRSPVTVDSDTLTKIRMFGANKPVEKKEVPEEKAEAASGEETAKTETRPGYVRQTVPGTAAQAEEDRQAERFLKRKRREAAGFVPFSKSVDDEKKTEAVFGAETSGISGSLFISDGRADVSWSFSDDTLSIGGEGEIADISPVPWAAFAGRIKNVRISDGIRRLPSYAFAKCTALSEIVIPDSVTSIGRNAFSGCAVLYSVKLPVALDEISEALFEDCAWLRELVLPVSLTVIHQYAFMNSGISALVLPEGLQSVRAGALSCCRDLGPVKVNSMKTRFADDALAFSHAARIYGPVGSVAEKYAVRFDIPFIEMEAR